MSARATSTAIAHPNIALAKYWGKLAGEGNRPAVPSLSVTLAGMSTKTRVTFDEAFHADEVILNGTVLRGDALTRPVALLDRVRSRAGETRRARVESENDFPTASGLASSASGFAALAVAAAGAAGLSADPALLSDFARRASASAARSLFGGFVELDAGTSDPAALLAAREVAPPDHLDLVVLVAVTSEGAKSVASTDGMRETAAKSPYFASWLDIAPRLETEIREALLARDFPRLGELTERSAFAMHASALGAGVVYWNGATLEVVRAVRAMRARGEQAYVTMDAGPHVKVLIRDRDAQRIAAELAEVSGVLRVLTARPGEGARLV